MKVIGLTGGIASGKSTISRYLRQLGAAIIDADLVAREVALPHTPGWQAIREHFGTEAFHPDGTLNRKELGNQVFSSQEKRALLNRILHPLIAEAVREKIDIFRKEGNYPLVVFDAPLLIEAGMTDLVDEVWLVAVPEEVQVSRLMGRDNITREEALQRLQSQMSLEEKAKYAHRIIDNNRQLSATYSKVKELWQEIAGNS